MKHDDRCSCDDVVRRAVSFDSPPRLPLTIGISAATCKVHGRKLRDLAGQYPNDFGWAGWSILDDGPAEEGAHVDEWGCTWKKLHAGMGGQSTNPPLADWSVWPDYNLPDALVDSRWAGVKQHVLRVREEKKYLLGGGGYLFERLIALRGFENILMDLALEPSELDELIEGIDRYVCATIRQGARFDVDGFIFGDDWGMEDRLFIHPDAWRKRFLPVYERWFCAVHSLGSKAHFHTDGNVAEILRDLVRMGADELNLQIGALDLDATADVCRGRICVRSGPDRQKVLPFWKPDDIRSYTRDLIQAFHTPEGGFIMSVKIDHDVPWENIVALFGALDEFL